MIERVLQNDDVAHALVRAIAADVSTRTRRSEAEMWARATSGASEGSGSGSGSGSGAKQGSGSRDGAPKTKAEKKAAAREAAREAAEKEADARELAAISAIVGKTGFKKPATNAAEEDAPARSPEGGDGSETSPMRSPSTPLPYNVHLAAMDIEILLRCLMRGERILDSSCPVAQEIAYKTFRETLAPAAREALATGIASGAFSTPMVASIAGDFIENFGEYVVAESTSKDGLRRRAGDRAACELGIDSLPRAVFAVYEVLQADGRVLGVHCASRILSIAFSTFAREASEKASEKPSEKESEKPSEKPSEHSSEKSVSDAAEAYAAFTRLVVERASRFPGSARGSSRRDWLGYVFARDGVSPVPSVGRGATRRGGCATGRVRGDGGGGEDEASTGGRGCEIGSRS